MVVARPQKNGLLTALVMFCLGWKQFHGTGSSVVEASNQCGSETIYVPFKVEFKNKFDVDTVHAAVQESMQDEFDNKLLEDAFKDTIKAAPEFLKEPQGTDLKNRVYNPSTGKYTYTGRVPLSPRGQLGAKYAGGMALQVLVDLGFGFGLTGKPEGGEESVAWSSQRVRTERCPTTDLPQCTSTPGRCTTVACDCPDHLVFQAQRSAVSGKDCWQCRPQCTSTLGRCTLDECGCHDIPNRIIVKQWEKSNCWACRRQCTTTKGLCTPAQECLCPGAMVKKETTLKSSGDPCWVCTDPLVVSNKAPTPSPIRSTPSPVSSASKKEKEEEEDGGVCFPGTSIVQVRDDDDDKSTSTAMPKRVDEVQVGDFVLSADSNGNPVYTEVVFLPHLKNQKMAQYEHLTCRADVEQQRHAVVRLTQNHFVLVSKSSIVSVEAPVVSPFAKAEMIPAHQVEVNDFLWIVGGGGNNSSLQETAAHKCLVESIDVVENEDGLYTLFTTNGKVAVDGILVSNYAADASGIKGSGYTHALAHAVVGPIYWVAHKLGWSNSSAFRSIFHESFILPVYRLVMWLM